MTWPNRADWLEKFRARIGAQRIPLSGMLELTSRCPMRCVHCYLGDQEARREEHGREMTAAQVKGLIDQMSEAGCLDLVITGGDPMLRRDFPQIYRYARQQGLVVSVFCSGTLITSEIVEVFCEYPPKIVEITLCGATAPVFERVTGIPGSFQRCLDGIRRLLEGGVRTGLKTVLMSLNQHQLEDMRAIASDLEVPFRLDSAIFGCLVQADNTPLELRVPPEIAIRAELEDQETVAGWKRNIARKDEFEPSDDLYICGAGISNFYIDPFGYISPCLMTTEHRHEVLGRNFLEVWTEQVPLLRQKKISSTYDCNSCEIRQACSSCPAFNHVENRSEEQKSEYICETARLRWQAITGETPRYGVGQSPHLPVREEADR